jgi:5-methylcytosine-specific restriction endonuclease McrA
MTIKLTKEEIESHLTPGGGYTQEQLAEWGVSWPPPKGWKNRLIRGKRILSKEDRQAGYRKAQAKREKQDKKQQRRRRKKLQHVPWLERNAQKAGYTSYSTYLQSPHWQALRDQVLERDKHRCTKCSAADKLQVHHLSYKRLGYEELDDLKTLCQSCHQAIHGRGEGGSAVA